MAGLLEKPEDEPWTPAEVGEISRFDRRLDGIGALRSLFYNFPDYRAGDRRHATLSVDVFLSGYRGNPWLRAEVERASRVNRTRACESPC